MAGAGERGIFSTLSQAARSVYTSIIEEFLIFNGKRCTRAIIFFFKSWLMNSLSFRGANEPSSGSKLSVKEI